MVALTELENLAAGGSQHLGALARDTAAEQVGDFGGRDKIARRAAPTTARTTPPYLICWLALACLGAVTVPVNPRSAPAELAGLEHQTRPRAIITDTGHQAGGTDASWALIAPGVPDEAKLSD